MRKDLILILLLVSILALMIIPISQQIIDVLLAMNLTLSVVLLMMAVYLKHSSDFSTFPSVILISTAFRLSLSIGTTRMILSEADGGQIIQVFGDFVLAGNVAIGLVIFLIVTVVQFLVVTKGAERVAEVGARFALDAMPGKQMSIDADIRAGVIDASEGEELRRRLDKDSQFFGAMDGAMKFIKGDAIAGLIIIAINLIGGIAVGVLSHGMTFSGAVSIYSLLTIGDGLVAQIPALLMSMCAGVIVTRVTSPDNEDLGSDIGRELLSDYRVPGISSVIAGGVAFIPGFPTFVFLGCSMALAILTFAIKRRLILVEDSASDAPEQPVDTRTLEETVPGEDPVEVSNRIRVLLNHSLTENLDIQQLKALSRTGFEKLCERYGIQFPHVQFVLSEYAPENSFVIECDEVPIGTETIPPEHMMVQCELSILLRAGCSQNDLSKIVWPDFVGHWVPIEFELALRDIEIEPEHTESRIAERIFRIYEANIGLLFSRIEFEALMTKFEALDSDAVSAIVTDLPRQGIFQVIQYLIEDGVPIRPPALFLESLLHWVQTSEVKTPILIAECIRSSLKRQLCHSISSSSKLLGLAMIDPALEVLMRQKVTEAKRSGVASAVDGINLPVDVLESVLEQVQTLFQGQRSNSHTLVLVTSADLRRRLRNMLSANNIDVPVLSAHEISPDVNALPIDMIKMPNVGKAAGRPRNPSGRRPRQSENTETSQTIT